MREMFESEPTAMERFEDKLESHGGERTNRPVALLDYQGEAARAAGRAKFSTALAVLRSAGRYEGGDHEPEVKAKAVSRAAALIGVDDESMR